MEVAGIVVIICICFVIFFITGLAGFMILKSLKLFKDRFNKED